MKYQDYLKIPNNLRKYRKIRGLKQKDVAFLLGLKSASRISRWETGKSFPSTRHALQLTIIYKAEWDDLFSDLVDTIWNEVMMTGGQEWALRKKTPIGNPETGLWGRARQDR